METMNENDCIISLFIDDELGLDEKIVFVERVHGNTGFKDETISLLNQEKLLRTETPDPEPLGHAAPLSRSRFFMPRPLHAAAAALASAVIILFSVLFWQQGDRAGQANTDPHRFVIYEPDARQVEITGSFTGWKRISLEKRGAGGYWEVTLPLSTGEHSFTYILDGSRKVADPTLPSSEMDDFGGENSILYTGGNA
jgi:hypothetical protein